MATDTEIDVSGIRPPAGATPIPAAPPAGSDVDTMMAWLTDREAAWDANEPALSVCPDWCVEKNAHDWEVLNANDYAYERTHTLLDLSSGYLQRSEIATKDRHYGWQPWAVVISPTLSEYQGVTDPDALRVMSAELAALARKLEEVQRQS